MQQLMQQPGGRLNKLCNFVYDIIYNIVYDIVYDIVLFVYSFEVCKMVGKSFCGLGQLASSYPRF